MGMRSGKRTWRRLRLWWGLGDWVRVTTLNSGFIVRWRVWLLSPWFVGAVMRYRCGQSMRLVVRWWWCSLKTRWRTVKRLGMMIQGWHHSSVRKILCFVVHRDWCLHCQRKGLSITAIRPSASNNPPHQLSQLQIICYRLKPSFTFRRSCTVGIVYFHGMSITVTTGGQRSDNNALYRALRNDAELNPSASG